MEIAEHAERPLQLRHPLPLRPQIGFQRFAWRLAPERFKAVVLTSDTPWEHKGAPMYFYRPAGLELRRGESLAQAGASQPRFFVIADAFAEPAAGGIVCEALYRPYPSWLRSVGERFPALRLHAWSLHRCRSRVPP